MKDSRTRILDVIRKSGSTPVTAVTLSSKLGMSHSAVRGHTHRLQREGLITGTRGRGGGYILADTVEEEEVFTPETEDPPTLPAQFKEELFQYLDVSLVANLPYAVGAAVLALLDNDVSKARSYLELVV